jgi:hypothetical protein
LQHSHAAHSWIVLTVSDTHGDWPIGTTSPLHLYELVLLSTVVL